MQPVAGPSGPPVAGPTGTPPVTGPSGPPVSGPSGPPSDVNPAQFDPLAEIEDARARRQDREERLESLEKRRNSARNNVYFFLALTVILGIFSFFPGPVAGDVSDNPQEGMGTIRLSSGLHKVETLIIETRFGMAQAMKVRLVTTSMFLP